MKYAKEFLEENMRIKPLADVIVDEDCDVLIGGKQTGIHISWREYVKWLESKYENSRRSGDRNMRTADVREIEMNSDYGKFE